MGREDEIVKERMRKIDELRRAGVNPYPHKFEKKNNSLDLQKEFSKLKNQEFVKGVKGKVSVAGRVMLMRNMGKIAFAKIRDGAGDIQIVLQDGETKENVFELFKKVDAGDFVGVDGRIFRTKRGELSVMVDKLEILCKSILPLPEKFHGLQDKEERYRKRYLDLIMNPDVKKVFERRSLIINCLRNFLKEEGFIELETPLIQPVYGGASAKPFVTHINALDMNAYLSIAPELYLKRLIVGGYEKIFTICKNFRNEGIDFAHNPEFTMMEYYATYKDYEYHIYFIEKFFEKLKKELKLGESIEYRGNKISLKTPFKRIKFRDLMLKETGIDIDKVRDFEKLKKEIKLNNLKVDISQCKHYGALLDEVYKRIVRPGILQPTLLTHYPVEMIALAKRNDEDPTKINSVQLIIDGAEIVKAYDELNDAVDQEKRFFEEQKNLDIGVEDAMPMDYDFVEALKYGMPPTAGLGIGIDRLVMILTGKDSIRDVILFPFMKPLDKEKE